MFEIGNSLREARMRRMLDLADAEHDTKIRLRYLSALEHEDFSVLPGAVYARGFLRTYARYLGLDPQTYIDEYNARFGQFEDLGDEPVLTVSRMHAQGSGSRRRATTLRWFFIVSLIAAALLLWEGLRTHHGHAAREQQVNGSVLGTTSAKGTAVIERNPALPTAATKKQAAKASAASTAVLRISAVQGATWIQVQRQSASGPIMFAGTLAKGSSKTFRAPRLYVSLGFASAAKLALPGQTLVPKGSGPAKYTVLPTGIRSAS